MFTSSCSLSCPWVGTQNCVIHQAGEPTQKAIRLSLGQLEGLKGFYHPHALPLCVSCQGVVRFGVAAEAGGAHSEHELWGAELEAGVGER